MNTQTQRRTTEFRVVAISKNTGSFGHHGHVMISREGIAVEGHRQRSPGNPVNGDLKVGDILAFEVDYDGMPTNWGRHHFEFMEPARQGNPPKDVFDMVWHPDFPANARR